MIFIIVRHGETNWNKENRIQGCTNIGLNEKGILQAKEISEALKGEKIGAIYCSDLERAVMTAKEINKHHNLPIYESMDLREINVGDCNGVLRSELSARFPEYVAEKKKDHFNTRHPNGESYKDVQERVKKLLLGFTQDTCPTFGGTVHILSNTTKKFVSGIKEKKGNILVVAHQGVNRTLIGYLAGINNQEMIRIDIPQDAIYFVDSKTKKVWHKVASKTQNGCLTRKMMN